MARQRKLPPGLWKRGNIYYARFSANGQPIRKKLSSDFKAACDILADLKARASRCEFGLLDNDYQWDDLKKEFLNWAKQAVRNAHDYERDLGQFEKYLKIKSVRQIDHRYIIGFRQWRLSQTVKGKKGGKSVCARSVNCEVATLRNMLNKGVQWQRIGSNPLAGLKPLRHDELRKQRRALTVEEVEALFREAPQHLKAPLRLIATTGIRRNELVTLRFSDIDFDARCMVIRPAIAKSRKRREIPLDDATLAMLADMKQRAKCRQPAAGLENRFSRDHVFVTKANTPLVNNLLRAFYAVCKRAGIEGAVSGGSVDLHSLRVTFTSLAIEHGASPKAIQAILGHSTLALTMGAYAKATERAKRDAISALPFATASAPPHIVSLHEAHKPGTTGNHATEVQAHKRLAN